MTTTPLTMLEFRPDVQAATRWMHDHGVVRAGHDDGYGWHALLTACFGELAPKPFRVVERAAGAFQVLAYSRAAAEALREHATTFATPAATTALALDRLSHKLMPGAFRDGQRLGFEVRVRPTVRQDRDGDRRRTLEVDAFLAAVQKAPPRNERPDLDRGTVYRRWLAERLSPAATIETFRLEAVRRAMLLCRNDAPDGAGPRTLRSVGLLERGKAGEQGGSPDVSVAGTLTVADSAAFSELLARGVGRHRSFGFGMLLLRPAQGR